MTYKHTAINESIIFLERKKAVIATVTNNKAKDS